METWALSAIDHELLAPQYVDRINFNAAGPNPVDDNTSGPASHCRFNHRAYLLDDLPDQSSAHNDASCQLVGPAPNHR